MNNNEIKVYLLIGNDIDCMLEPDKLTNDEFKELAIKNETVFSLQQFQAIFNNDSLGISSFDDYIRFIKD